MAQLDGGRHLVPTGARAPVPFFADPGLPGLLTPDSCRTHTLATTADDIPAALGDLADTVAADTSVALKVAVRPTPPTGTPTAATAVRVLLPEAVTVLDEADTSGLRLPEATASAPSHAWLPLTGGAGGQGLPPAAGSALARPDRAVRARRPAAAPCTPSRRCGPLPARGSTSPP